MTPFAERLLAWYDESGRKDLPWQQEVGAYGIWVSEIMLQQTRVQTVIPYYRRFMQRFPDVVGLADAPADDVLRHWSGLGYYARARNLHRAAQAVRDQHGGEFPRDFDDVVALPGIGRSTAGAILALAFGERQPILDGNVKRVLARHEAIGGWPGKTPVANALWAVAEQNTPVGRVADYTQALMDLGATLCTRARPDCARCPVRADCEAAASGSVADYPGRRPRKEKPQRETTMVLALADAAVYLERRPASGIWGGLWSLPEIEDGDVDSFCERILATGAHDREEWRPLRHSFSHFDLHIRPVVVRANGASRTVADNDDAIWAPLADIPPGGIAAPVQKLINQLKNEDHVTNR